MDAFFNVCIILMLLTPFGVGKEQTGNNSWLAFPFLPMNIQPAEVAKIFFVLLLAFQCRKLQDWGISRFTSVVQLAGHSLFMAALIAVVSGDFGMVLVYLGLFVIIAWTAGVKKRWFLLALVLGVAAVIIVWPHVPGYIQGRFTVVIDHITGNPDTYVEQTQGRGWQQTRSILAIGSGGLFGQGYLQGTQTQSASEEALPARHTDEIFAVCGEEFGMVGCILVILLLTAIILRCVWVARRANSPMAAYVAMGYAAMLLLQTVINIGMCLYVFPVVGLTLPFLVPEAPPSSLSMPVWASSPASRCALSPVGCGTGASYSHANDTLKGGPANAGPPSLMLCSFPRPGLHNPCRRGSGNPAQFPAFPGTRRAAPRRYFPPGAPAPPAGARGIALPPA